MKMVSSFFPVKGGILNMPKCIYCGKDYGAPRGMTLVMNDGSVKHLCSSKCKRNMLMKRRKVRWISKKKKVKEKSA